MILRAKKRLGHRCTLKPGFAEDLPFDDNEFDLAVFILTLEFLEDPLQALREAGRVAKQKVFICAINGLSYRGAQKWVQGQLGHPLFRRATFYNLWQLKGLLRAAFGNSPTEWASVPNPRDDEPDRNRPGPRERMLRRNPFRFILGFSVRLQYTVKTDNLPIQVGMKQASRSLLDAGSFQEFHCTEGLQTDERSLLV
jgi:SAM-dependent methyltransferase